MTSNSDPSPTPSRAPAAGHWWQERRIVAIAILGLAAAGGALWLASPRPSAAAKMARSQGEPTDPSLIATPVVATPARQGSLDIYLFALGTVTPLNIVEVRSRVDGELMSIAFKEGQMVKAGDLLAQIDPKPFEIQLTLATGQLARDKALLERAQIDLERYRMLFAEDSISSQQVDTQESLVQQYKAALNSAQGGVDNATLQLSHSRIIAPISGRVGLRQVGPGNIVRASDNDGIVVITQLQPIGILFPIPESDLPRVLKLLRAGKRVPVDAFDRDQKKKLGSGQLLTTDNQIDPATGTIRLKAEFPNTDGSLFANQFANVRMLVETRPKATLVPTAAIQHGATGTFVYVVKDDTTALVTPVTVGIAQGEVTAIESGISAGTLVVVEGADRLRDNAKVELQVRDKDEGNKSRPRAQNPGTRGGA